MSGTSWTRQPPPGTRVDLTHPLAAGLKWWVDANLWEATGRYPLLNDSTASVTRPFVSPAGPGIRVNSGGKVASTDLSLTAAEDTTGTIIILCILGTTTTKNLWGSKAISASGESLYYLSGSNLLHDNTGVNTSTGVPHQGVNGQPYYLVIPYTTDGTTVTYRPCANGKQLGTMTHGYTGRDASGWLFGNNFFTGSHTNGVFLGWGYSRRVLTQEQAIAFSANPWQIFRAAADIDEIAAITAAGGTSLTPTSGRITYTGKTPSINLPVSLTPSSGHVTYTGKTPSVSQPTSLTPTSGRITYTGKTPSVDQDITLAPSSGRITYTGKTPTVDQTSATSLTPTSGHITFTGYAPSVDQDITLNPSSGHVTYTGKTPSVTQSNALTPTPGHITLTGYAPSVDQDISLTPSLGHITYTGKTPSVTQSAGLSGRAKYWNGSAWEAITFV